MRDGETTSFPEWVVPMAATLTQERFTGPEWIFERKFDGIRMLAFKNDADVKLYSRNRLLQHYPAVADAIGNLPVHDVILDGEAAWDSSSRVAYHVFDILWLEGRSVMPLPLDTRRTLLKDFSFRAPLDKIEIPNSPFTKAKGLPRIRAHWVLPEIVVQVAFIEWTVHGKLRHPRLLAVRYDKSPREVVRQTW